MNIPKRFKEILEKDQSLFGIVNSTISTFESIIEDSKFEFFEEYTKHETKHLENVLRAAEWLIPDESMILLNSHDIAVLILSIVLHDLGMHLTHEGLKSLLAGSFNNNKVSYFDDLTWTEAWNNFFEEARRWNGKKLKLIFGEERVVEKPSDKKEELNGYDRKLYGEFLRINHPRLGHEIALHGFPAKNKLTLAFGDGLSNVIKDIIGLVVRSHGLRIRVTFNYLVDKFGAFGWRTPYDVKIIYLMVILRIADYLHITSDRAINLQVRNLSSPLSSLEQDKHNSIEFINRNHEDPETLYVQAQPANSSTFLGLERLFKDIQEEMDVSWAVLGEVYGRFDELRNLKISIRRIQSNLDDKKWFSSKINYLPEKVTFESDPELLKLLIAPLYGDNPSYAVRELVQNAIDACHEREHIMRNSKSYCTEEISAYVSKVEIKIDRNSDKDYCFSIQDNGVGMSEDTIINYFLKAGSTFRKSDAWLRNFTDEKGDSKIQRSGRFGVGVLASFLLGSKIYVSTRNVSEGSGLEFTASIDDEQIEIRKITRPIGTTIKIKLTKQVYERLENQYRWNTLESWDLWYTFVEPELSLSVPNNWIKSYNRKLGLIDIKSDLDKWHTMYPNDFEKVHWSYHYGEEKHLICNGIIVPRGYEFNKSRYVYPSFDKLPTVVVIDKNGKLPLSLDRSRLNDKLYFEEDLAKDICRDIIAELLTYPNIKEPFNRLSLQDTFLKHPSFSKQDKVEFSENELLLLNEGYCLLHTYFIEKLELSKITRLWINNEKGFNINNWLGDTCISISRKKLESLKDFKKGIYDEVLGFGKGHKVLSKRIFIPSSKVKYLLDRSSGSRFRKEYMENVKVEENNDIWTFLTYGNPIKLNIAIDQINDYLDDIDLIVEYYINAKNTNYKKSGIFADLLNEYLGEDALIPYDYEQRKNKFPKAFKDLQKYMVKYLS